MAYIILMALIIADIIFIICTVIQMIIQSKKSKSIEPAERKSHLIRAEVSPEDYGSSKEVSKELMKQIIIEVKKYTKIKFENNKFVCEFLILNTEDDEELLEANNDK